jgi:hypothetical protein
VLKRYSVSISCPARTLKPPALAIAGQKRFAAAYRAVATIRWLLEIEIRLEAHGSAMAASRVGLHHSVSHLMAATMSL